MKRKLDAEQLKGAVNVAIPKTLAQDAFGDLLQGEKPIEYEEDWPPAEPERKTLEWIPLKHEDEMTTDFPWEMDGKWVIVTNGKTVEVERIKKDAYDHFYPNGRSFELDEVIAWMPLPEPWKGETNEAD